MVINLDEDLEVAYISFHNGGSACSLVIDLSVTLVHFS